jgi:hypothetical protein
MIKEKVFDLMLELDINYLPRSRDCSTKLYNDIIYYFSTMELLKEDMEILRKDEYVVAISRGRIKISQLK